MFSTAKINTPLIIFKRSFQLLQSLFLIMINLSVHTFKLTFYLVCKTHFKITRINTKGKGKNKNKYIDKKKTTTLNSDIISVYNKKRY